MGHSLSPFQETIIAQGSEEERQLVGGALVRIHSLQCSQYNAQYNDKIGMLHAYNKDKARWSVSILEVKIRLSKDPPRA